MKILYISTVFPSENENSTIYTDLAECISEQGHQIIVVSADSNSSIKRSAIYIERGLKVLRVPILPIYNVGLLKKGLGVLTLKFFLVKSIRKYLSDESFDLILFESPPTNLVDVVNWAMKKYNCKSFLMLKDIFPQNAVDINLIKDKSLLHQYFKAKEKKLYNTASHIGTMSDMNRKYILSHNKYLDEEKISIFPNTKKFNEIVSTKDSKCYREKYEIPLNSFCILYGGNLGIPQGIDFLLEILDFYKSSEYFYFVIVGRGTEWLKINEFILTNQIFNVKLMKALPRIEYEQLALEMDLGMILLNRKFTIPNYPSRILSYFEVALPVIAATDGNTDYRNLIEVSRSGYWCEAGNLTNFDLALKEISNSRENAAQLGLNGQRYLIEYLQVEKSVMLLEKYYKSISYGGL